MIQIFNMLATLTHLCMSFTVSRAVWAFNKYLNRWRRATFWIAQNDQGLKTKISSESVIVSICILLCELYGKSYHKEIRKPCSKSVPSPYPFIVGKKNHNSCYCHYMKEWANPQRFIFSLNKSYSFKPKGVFRFYRTCMIYFLSFLNGYL